MAKGDQNDFLMRLHALLPQGWFNDNSRILTGTLSACATSLSWCYTLYRYACQQTRISSACDGWLDIVAYDFLGGRLIRQAGVSDENFRHQIRLSLFRERGTRQAVTDIIEMLTGNKPVVFEPSRPEDTGSYGGKVIGYGTAGRYGSCCLPYQAFVDVSRPRGQGISRIAGYGVSTAGFNTPSYAQYASREMFTGSVSDAQIYAAIESVKPEGTLVWVKIH